MFLRLKQKTIWMGRSLRWLQSERNENMKKKLFAVLRVDTHGNRFVVEQDLSWLKAKEMEKHFDSMTHHQGYYVVEQEFVQQELKRTDL